MNAMYCKLVLNKTEKIFSLIGCAKSDKYYKKLKEFTTEQLLDRLDTVNA